jgi:translation initiation factor 1
MSDICSTCGLPKDLCVCETIAKESQKITGKTIKKKFGKVYTIIEGINEHEIDLKDLAKKLKSRFACGGTAKDGIVELQGDHLKQLREELMTLGFAPETIEIKNKK